MQTINISCRERKRECSLSYCAGVGPKCPALERFPNIKYIYVYIYIK
jgi:hypothetical protein